MATNPFLDWLDEVATDEIVICPDNVNTEAHGNLWQFSLDQEQAKAVTPVEVETFASGVIAGRRAWLAARNAHPMILYWWHDAQAGQLRFSLVSASHGRLPFGCAIKPAESIRAVAADWLDSEWLHGIPLDSLRCLAPDEEPRESPPFVLPVWSVRVP